MDIAKENEKFKDFVNIFSTYDKSEKKTPKVTMDNEKIMSTIQENSRKANLLYFISKYCQEFDKSKLFTMINETLARPVEGTRCNYLKRNSGNLYTLWIKKITQLDPENFAECIASFLNENDMFEDVFSTVLFPTLYLNFVFEDYQQAAEKFLKKLAGCTFFPRYFKHLNAFLRSSPHFLQVLWKMYDKLLIQLNNDDPQTNSFHALYKAFQFAIRKFSIHQIEILKFTYKISPSKFSENFFGEFLLDSFLEYHPSLGGVLDENPLVKNIQFISNNPKSPQFNLLYGLISTSSIFEHYMSIKASHNVLNSYYLSSHELWVLESFVKMNPGEIFRERFIQSISINEAFHYKFSPIIIKSSIYGIVEEIEPIQTLFFDVQPEIKIECSKTIKSMLNIYQYSYGEKSLKECEVPINSLKYFQNMLKDDPIYQSKEFKDYFEVIKYNRNLAIKKELELYLQLKTIEEKMEILSYNLQEKIDCLLYLVAGDITKSNANFMDFESFLNSITKNKENTSSKKIIESKSFAVTRFLNCFNIVNISSLEEMNRILSTNRYNPNGLGIDANQYATIVTSRASFFEPSFDIPIEKPNFKHTRKRRLSDDFQQMSSVVKGIRKKFKEITQNEIMFPIFIKSMNTFEVIDPKLPSLQKIFTQYINNIRIKKLSKDFKDLKYAPYIWKCASKLNQMVALEKGSAILQLLEYGRSQKVIISKLGEEMGKKFFVRCIAASTNNNSFTIFIWMERFKKYFLTDISILPQPYRQVITFLEDQFWYLINKVSPEFKRSCENDLTFSQ